LGHTTELDLFEGVPVAHEHARDGFHARQESLVEKTGYKLIAKLIQDVQFKNEEAV